MTLIEQIQAIREERDRLKLDVALLIDHCRKAIPEAEHPAEPTVSNWCWQLHALGEDRRAAYKFQAEAEASLAALRARVKEYLAAIDFDDDETAPPDLCEACQRTEQAKAALRTEVERG